MNLSHTSQPNTAINSTFWDDSFGNSLLTIPNPQHLIYCFVYFCTGHHPSQGATAGPVEPIDNQF